MPTNLRLRSDGRYSTEAPSRYMDRVSKPTWLRICGWIAQKISRRTNEVNVRKNGIIATNVPNERHEASGSIDRRDQRRNANNP